MDAWEDFIEWVRDEFDMDTLRDINEHGAHGGIPGYSYYSNVNRFWLNNQELCEEAFEELIYEYLHLDFKEVMNQLLDNNCQFHNLRFNIFYYMVEMAAIFIVEDKYD